MLASRISILIAAVGVFMTVWVGIQEAPRTSSNEPTPEPAIHNQQTLSDGQPVSSDYFLGTQQVNQPLKQAEDVAALASSVPDSQNLSGDASAKRDYPANRSLERSDSRISKESPPTPGSDAEHTGQQLVSVAECSDLAGQEPITAQTSPSTDVATSRIDNLSAWPTHKKYDFSHYKEHAVSEFEKTRADVFQQLQTSLPGRIQQWKTSLLNWTPPTAIRLDF